MLGKADEAQGLDKLAEEREGDWQLGSGLRHTNDSFETSGNTGEMFRVEGGSVKPKINVPQLEGGKVTLEQAVRPLLSMVVCAPFNKSGGGGGERSGGMASGCTHKVVITDHGQA